jgi:phage terminase large subunit GpA-like protein
MAKEKTYSEKLKDPRWQKLRLLVFNRDKWKCKKCGDKNTTLNVHHIEYNQGAEPWDYPMQNFVTLCEHCHLEVEELKSEAHISDVNIIKIDGWGKGGRLVMFSTNEKTVFKFYNAENEININLLFDNHTSEQIKSFITKSLKRHGQKTNG